MPSVNINIRGTRLELNCGEGQEASLQQYADELNAELTTLSDNLGNMPENTLLIMAALTMKDQLHNKQPTTINPSPEKNQEIQEKLAVATLNAGAEALESVCKQLEKIACKVETV